MANWKNNISVEVKLPYTTQGCTLGYLTAKLNITNEDIWFSDTYGLCWKADLSWGDYRILVIGKATTKDYKTCATTTYKVSAWPTWDGMNKAEGKQYKCRVVSYS